MFRQGETINFAIVGMGRAGRIHLNALKARTADCAIRWIVDLDPQLPDDVSRSARVTAHLQDALDDPDVHAVIVATPTASHAEVIRSALDAGKHVFAEKPLCCHVSEIATLFDRARRRRKLLFTAYNRRCDPRIVAARDAVRSGRYGKVQAVTLVSRDDPYPPTSYLQTSGNIFKDCVVHDLDYLTWILDEPPSSLRARASTTGDARSAGTWEFSEVHLDFRSGATAHLISCRASESYDHRLDIYCERGFVQVTNPFAEAGVTFAQRFDESYHAQLGSFVGRLAAADFAPNISLERTVYLEALISACEQSVATGECVMLGD